MCVHAHFTTVVGIVYKSFLKMNYSDHYNAPYNYKQLIHTNNVQLSTPLSICNLNRRFIQYESNQIRGCTLLLTQQTNVISDKACLTPRTPILIQYGRQITLLDSITVGLAPFSTPLQMNIVRVVVIEIGCISSLACICTTTTLQWTRLFLFRYKLIIAA